MTLLRQLSEASSQLTPSTKSSSPNSSRSGSVQKKAPSSKKPQKAGKVPVKVFLDNDVETVVDLLEYKQNLEQINSIIEEIESSTAAAAEKAAAEKNSSNQNRPETEAINDQVINETLRVAKKIEKISIAGIGRQVSLPSPQSFLPPGWHCRKTDHEGWEYINSDGYKVKSIQAAIKHEAKFKRRSSMRTTKSELLNTTVP